MQTPQPVHGWDTRLQQECQVQLPGPLQRPHVPLRVQAWLCWQRHYLRGGHRPGRLAQRGPGVRGQCNLPLQKGKTWSPHVPPERGHVTLIKRIA